MPTHLKSTAPHLSNPAQYPGPLHDWGWQNGAAAGQGKSDGLLLHKSADGFLESGLWQCGPGRWPLALPRDELCHFLTGKAVYESSSGQRIEVGSGSVVLFPAGWEGTCDVKEAIRNVYMLGGNGGAVAGAQAKVLTDPAVHAGPFTDWGIIPTMIEGRSETSGLLLHKGPAGESECGIWICTPGYWNCYVTRDEFCHFLSGSCTYTHESGEVIEIAPDTVAFFPKDWRGTCRVHETVRKVYMIS